jgi:hypothetical protein
VSFEQAAIQICINEWATIPEATNNTRCAGRTQETKVRTMKLQCNWLNAYDRHFALATMPDEIRWIYRPI